MAGTAGLAGCGATEPSGSGSARLTSRLHPPGQSIAPGTYLLSRPGVADHAGYLLVPTSYHPARLHPLVVGLHGGGGSATQQISAFGPYAEDHGFLLLTPQSRGGSWDAIAGSFGPDVGAIDGLLAFAFDRCVIDPDRVILEGFSDGASYTLGLGRANGDLFTRLVAFSPGDVPRSSSGDHRRPQIFVSHGHSDPVLLFSHTANQTVPELRRKGYQVLFVEFDGGHSIPTAVREEAITWMLR